MYGVMGISNAQRHLEQVRSLVEFISQDGIKEVVPMISLVNEVQATIVGEEVLSKLSVGSAGYGRADQQLLPSIRDDPEYHWFRSE